MFLISRFYIIWPLQNVSIYKKIEDYLSRADEAVGLPHITWPF